MQSKDQSKHQGGTPLQHLLLASAVFLLMSYMQHFNAQVNKNRLPATTANGNLMTSKTLVSTTKFGAARKTLVFTLAGYPNEFRVEPKYVDALLDNSVPTELRSDAMVSVDVSAAELASPSHPGGRPELSIVWVYGMSIEGRPLSTMTGVDRVDKKDARLGWLMIVLAGIYWVIAIVWWFRSRKRDGV